MTTTTTEAATSTAVAGELPQKVLQELPVLVKQPQENDVPPKEESEVPVTSEVDVQDAAPIVEPAKVVESDDTAAEHVEELPEVLTGHREPLKLSGALDEFEKFDVTPIIGREFVNVNLAEWLRAPNSDDLIRDLAITST